MEKKKANFIFSGFEKLDETPKPKERVVRKKKRTVKPKENDGTTKGKKIPLTGFYLELINDTIRSNIKKYYRSNKHIAHETMNNSVRVAEKLIKDNMTELLGKTIAEAESVKHTMSFKGWNITLLGKLADDPRLSITCIFKPNYVRRYNITIITEHSCYSIYNHQIACEKTVYFPDEEKTN